MSPELNESRSATCLELEIEYCGSATRDCQVFVESETAPQETVPLTEEWMQTEVLKGASDFGSKDFFVLKGKGLVLATSDEFKELTELCTALEGTTERGTEVALSLVLCDKIENVGERTSTLLIWWVRRLSSGSR